MSTQPPLPTAGQTPWDTALNDYISTLDARVALLEQQTTGVAYQYVYNNNVAPPPASGQIRLNNVVYDQVSLLYIHKTSDNGIDLTNALATSHVGKKLYFQDKNDATRWVKYTVNADTDQGTYHQWGVTFTDKSATPLASGQACMLVIS